MEKGIRTDADSATSQREEATISGSQAALRDDWWQTGRWSQRSHYNWAKPPCLDDPTHYESAGCHALTGGTLEARLRSGRAYAQPSRRYWESGGSGGSRTLLLWFSPFGRQRMGGAPCP